MHTTPTTTTLDGESAGDSSATGGIPFSCTDAAGNSPPLPRLGSGERSQDDRGRGMTRACGGENVEVEVHAGAQGGRGRRRGEYAAKIRLFPKSPRKAKSVRSTRDNRSLSRGSADPLSAQPKSSSRVSRSLDPATPWLGWDFVRHDGVDSAGADTIGGDNVGDEGGNLGGKGGEGDDDDSDEEPKANRKYGTDKGEEASVNKMIAFQTDRVVRILDRLF